MNQLDALHGETTRGRSTDGPPAWTAPSRAAWNMQSANPPADSDSPSDPAPEPIAGSSASSASSIPGAPRLSVAMFRYLGANLLIGLFLYANAAIILEIPISRFWPDRRIPLRQPFYSAFHLFGVFSHYETFNREIELYGETAATEAQPDGELIRLSNAEFFAFRHGEILSRVLVCDNIIVCSREQRQAALRDLAARIRRRYNRLHPERPIEKVVIAEATWPRSVVSYDLLKANATVDILYAE